MKIENSKYELYLRNAIMTGAIMLGSFAISRGLDEVYTKVRGEKAPNSPENDQANWTKALIWGVCTGALMGAAKTFLRPVVSRFTDQVLNR